MKVLMFGWEFPPWNSGGLGTACYGLCKGLSNQNTDVIFVLPRVPDDSKTDVAKLVSADLKKIKLKSINSPMVGYMTKDEYNEIIKYKKGKRESSIYGKDLLRKVKKYALSAKELALVKKKEK